MDLDILSTPIQIGKKTAPNRLVNHPMECNDGDEMGNPTELTFDRYRQLAAGGAGIITIESATILNRSRARKNQLEITERNTEALTRLVREMKSINDQSLIIFQINHSGNISNGSFSEVVSYYPTGDPNAAILTDEDVAEIKGWFVDSAKIAHITGADGIDFKNCHGYFCGQLLRPANTKAGRFGGCFENRTRFFRETADDIKKSIKDETFVLGTRISIYEGIVGGFGTAGPEAAAEDLKEPLSFTRLIEDTGFHFISVSGGVPVFSGEITRPTKEYPLGVYRHFGWAAAVKKTANIPIIGSGYSYLRNGKNSLHGNVPEKKHILYWAAKNIRDGHVDLVGVGRQSLADPMFAKKVIDRDLDKINYCVACGGCSTLLKNQARVGCAVYNSFYKEALRRIKRTEKKKR